MAQHFMQPILPQEALTGQYSVLHQERLYLLEALAEEETQGERLTQALMSLQAQIEACEAHDSPGNGKRLKQLRQQAKSVRNRIGACQNRERALALNVSGIVAQMEGVKRYHWINEQQNYAIQLAQAQQHAHMVLMSPARPAFALRSPANIDLAAQMQYMSLAPQPEPVFGNRASLDPHMGTLNQVMPYVAPTSVVGNMYQPDTSAEWNGMIAWPAFNEVSGPATIPSSAVTASYSCVSPTTHDWLGVKTSILGRQRASSMLDTVPEHQPSQQRYAPNSALRRLSLLDGSAALKLEREAAEERAKEFGGW